MNVRERALAARRTGAGLLNGAINIGRPAMQGMEPFKKMVLVWNEIGENVGSTFRVKNDTVYAVKTDGAVFEMGMDDFMAKPVNEIVEAIKGA